MYNTPFLVLGSALDLSDDATSDALESQGSDFVGFEIAWSGLSANTGTITVEGAMSGLYWCALADSYTITSDPDHKFFMVNPYAYRKLRIRYVANSNTSGSMTILYGLKIPRQGDAPGPG